MTFRFRGTFAAAHRIVDVGHSGSGVSLDRLVSAVLKFCLERRHEYTGGTCKRFRAAVGRVNRLAMLGGVSKVVLLSIVRVADMLEFV